EHPAAQRLWLVRPARPRHIRTVGAGPGRARAIRRGGGGIVRPGVRLMPSRFDDQQYRRLIAEYFGASARLRMLRATAAFGAPVFVVDFDRGPRHYRTFGSFRPSFG